ncbi:MAG: hypothetical protein H8E73_09235 [Planctomycetes bacterium]|nr:hypothetical protein [Planctomycetota bacterium]
MKKRRIVRQKPTKEGYMPINEDTVIGTIDRHGDFWVAHDYLEFIDQIWDAEKGEWVDQ